jgi:histidinol-phosphate aminotransferase
MSANENPRNVPTVLVERMVARLRDLPFNRYPDPLANTLRDDIANAYGLERTNVLVGNGGDELLFDIALAWGGPGRTLLNFPPTFSVYAANARLTHTTVESIDRLPDFTLNEEAILERVAKGKVQCIMITSPNNPTGQCARLEFIEQLLNATDALVVVDEAYGEFAGQTVLPLLEAHQNLLILKTFSKAYALAGVRLGYVLAHASVINELIKVRQPYSVDAVSQAFGEVVFENRALFESGIEEIISERARVFEVLTCDDAFAKVEAFPSDANWILMRVPQAHEAWDYLYSQGVLVRDFSSAPLLGGCLRVTIGTPAENDRFLRELKVFLGKVTS